MNDTRYNPLKRQTRALKIAATDPGNPYEHKMVYDPSLGFQFKEINPTQWNGWRHFMFCAARWMTATPGTPERRGRAAGLFSTVEDVQKAGGYAGEPR